MSASRAALVCCFFCLVPGVPGTLRGPARAHLTSTNMDLVFRWEPAPGAPTGLTYSTEYRSSATPFRPGCVKISTPECDLTPFNISVYGMYTARVRAQLGDQGSEWVLSNNITLDRETSIGSPSVSLLSIGENLELVIKDPKFRVSRLRSVYSSATYNITYWKKNQENKARNVPDVQQNRVILDDLAPSSEYCVQVQIHTVKNPKPSFPSEITCGSTAGEKESPWVAALVVFVVMAAVVALVVVVVLRWKRISHFLCPKHVLPEYFKESLLDPPSSSLCFVMQNCPPVEEINHQVDVVPSARMLEEGDPLKAVESSCRDQLQTPGENRQHVSEETL
ncbi:cytokine receptor family member b4 [Cololabis saira]|uniref:cytokine receptor family member b4 n=1 Tax=Cololabis saira TaxID=129043 RepID=UPI002AD49C16|nr:cytokine receptor family member b4 [Cololabis saira]